MTTTKLLASIQAHGETYEMYKVQDGYAYRRTSDGRPKIPASIKIQLIAKATN